MERGYYKKGMSSVIASLLIIMLVLVVALILWVVVKNLMHSQSEISEMQKSFFAEDMEITSVKADEPLIRFSLERKGERIGMNQREL